MFPLTVISAEEPAVAGRRDRNKLRTRARLSGAALELFATQGYDATTIDQITEAADVSLRTFFRYFDSKEDVLFPRGDIDHPFFHKLRKESLDLDDVAAVRNAIELLLPRSA